MSGKGRPKTRRGYRPGVESLESIRLLSSLASLPIAPAFDPSAVVIPAPGDVGLAVDTGHDLAEIAAQYLDLLGSSTPTSTAGASGEVDPRAAGEGLAQLDRYLGRTWFRAGIAPQQHDDCTQQVYASLLGTLGRDRFDALLGEIGSTGIRDVLSRETDDGPDFFRAIDAVKKRAQRERSFQPLDGVEVASGSKLDRSRLDAEDSVREAILQALSPREAALIHATLQGETPAEIANQWGIAPKTVSNEKTRALQKLRDALSPTLADE